MLGAHVIPRANTYRLRSSLLRSASVSAPGHFCNAPAAFAASAYRISQKVEQQHDRCQRPVHDAIDRFSNEAWRYSQNNYNNDRGRRARQQGIEPTLAPSAFG